MWLWLSLAFVVFLFLLPLRYGWSFRGWGPPYPRAYVGGESSVHVVPREGGD